CSRQPLRGLRGLTAALLFGASAAELGALGRQQRSLHRMSNFTHLIAVLGIAARAADIVSTRLVSPTLALESNALMRRLGWRGAWATLAIGLIAYWSVELGVIVIMASLLVASSNLGRG